MDSNPGYKWKMLKAAHLRLRFIDNFTQVVEQTVLRAEEAIKRMFVKRGNEEDPKDIWIDIKRLNSLWF